MIANFSKRTIWWSVSAIVILLAIAVLGLTDAVAKFSSKEITISNIRQQHAMIADKYIEMKNISTFLNLEKVTKVLVAPDSATNSIAMYELYRQFTETDLKTVNYRNYTTGNIQSAEIKVEHEKFLRNVPAQTSSRFYYHDKYGYMKGHTIVVPAIYDEAMLWFNQDGYAAVKLDGKWGVVDTLNSIQIPFKYDELDQLNNKLIRFRVDGKYGFADFSGKEIIPARFEDAKDFREGQAVVKSDGKWGSVNRAGEWVIEPQYEDLNNFVNGFAGYRTNTKWGFVNKNGKEITLCQFFDCRHFYEGLAAVSVNGKWGFVGKNGELVISPQFEQAEDFQQGLAAVRINGKYGFIDRKGELVIPPKYDSAAGFANGVAIITMFEDADLGIPGRLIMLDPAGNEFTHKVAK